MINPLTYRARRTQPRPDIVWLPDTARSLGVYAIAGRGAGKSRMLGRIITAQDALRGVPQVIWDAVGGTVDNFLDTMQRLPPERQAAMWSRIRYVEMSGHYGYVVPWPLYQKRTRDTLYETAQRILESFKRLDPELASASIEGLNALKNTGTAVGMILTALGGQITEAEDVLANPQAFEAALLIAQQQYPELESAISFLFALSEDKNRERRIGSFLNKIAPFRLDPTMRAMFGSADPGIDWEQVVARGETVLLDFRHELDNERRRFKMLWVFQSFLDFVKHRGAGRHTPVGLVIDELTTLLNFDTQAGSQIFSADLDELINVIARNYRVWLTLCHQEFFQIDLKTRKTLMGMGTKIIGVTQDAEAALTLADELFPYDPMRVKRFDPIYGFNGQLIDLQPVEWTIPEQQRIAAQMFTSLKPFHFLIKPAEGEGDVTGSLYPLNTENIDRGIWVDEPKVQRIRQELLKESGQPIDQVLASIEERRRRFLGMGGAYPYGGQPAQNANSLQENSPEPKGAEDDFSIFTEPSN